MACRLLAFGIAACLSLAGFCQETMASSLARQSQAKMLGLVYIRDARPVEPAKRPVAQQHLGPAESIVLFREPTIWEGYRTYVILIGAVVLLAESALIVLLMLQMRRRKRSEQSVRRLTRRLIHASEEERRHLARELHDDIGQRLSLISVGLGSLSRMRAMTGQDGVQEVEQSLEELQTLISDVHGLSHRLHSSKLELLGLQGALRELCQQIARRHNLQIDLQMDEIGCDLDKETSLSFYRAAQEALSNVVRHSSSSRAAVHLIVSRGVLGLQVKDEGAGFETSKTPAGLGMVTMEERLRSVGGRLSVTSTPGEGTTVSAQVSLVALKHQKSVDAKRPAKAAIPQETLTDKQA